MTYSTLNIAEGTMKDDQNQNSREIGTQTTPKDEGIPKKLCCPIGLEVMVDPVMAPDGKRYERANIEEWLRTKHTSPVTRQEFSLPVELRTDYDYRDEVDRYLSPEDIEKRRQSDRERERKQEEELKREREPLLTLGINEEEIKQLSSIDKARILRNNLDLVKILLHETPVSWHDLMQTHPSILRKILPSYSFFHTRILLKSGIPWNELTQTNMALLEKLLPYAVDLKILLAIGISWDELVQTDFNTLGTILNDTVSAEMLLNAMVPWNELVKTDIETLKIILRGSVPARRLLHAGITWNDLKHTSHETLKKILDDAPSAENLLKSGVAWNNLIYTDCERLKKTLYFDNGVKTLMTSGILWDQLVSTDINVLENILSFPYTIMGLIEIGVPFEKLAQTNLEILKKILSASAETKTLLKTGIFWDELTHINCITLEKILHNSEHIKTLAKFGISTKDIVQFSEKLQTCFEKKLYSENIIKFIKTHLVSFDKLMEIPINQVIDLLSEKSIIRDLIQEIKLPFAHWINLPDESKNFLFDHSEIIQQLSQKHMVDNRFAWHTDLLEGILENEANIQQWFSEHPPYNIYKFYKNLIDIHIQLRKENPKVMLACHPDQYLQYFQKEEEKGRFLFYFYREISKNQLDFLDHTFKNQKDRSVFEDEIMLPVIEKDYNLHFRHYLASFDNMTLLAKIENAALIVPALITLADCIPERLGCSPNDLPESYARFLSHQFLDHYIQYAARTRVPTTETSISILFINYYLYNLIEQLQAKQYYLRTHAAEFQFLKTLEKIQSVFSGEWYCLLSSGNFKEGVSLYQFYVVLQAEAQLIEKIISKDITHRSVFRRDTGLQIFCVILNVLLLICVPISWPVYATRLILHCCNKDKYPNILFLPDHPIAREAQACQSQINELIERVEQDQRTLPCSSKDFSIYMHSKSKDSSTSLPLPEIRL